jgi:hypothetical protein
METNNDNSKELENNKDTNEDNQENEDNTEINKKEKEDSGITTFRLGDDTHPINEDDEVIITIIKKK